MDRWKISRRALLGGMTGAAVQFSLGTLSQAAAVPPPKETGLSTEGLLAGHPGFQRRSVAPLPYAAIPGFLSASQLAAHHAEYAKAVETLNETEHALATTARDAAHTQGYAALRHRQVTAANDVLLHEFYFGNLAPAPRAAPAYVQRNMHEHMGSLESWAADFTACAMVARAWAALVYDPYDDRWHNAIMDSNTDGVWVGANPLVVCDVAPHAWRADYQRRKEYVVKFLAHIDWNAVAARYHHVDRM